MDDQLTRLRLNSYLDHPSNNDLWLQAIEKLSAEDTANINFSYDKLKVLSDLKAETLEAQQRCKDKRLHFKRKNGQNVVMRDVFGKIIKWIDLFKDVGDVAVQYDPSHATLPWALVRFLIQASINDVEKYDFLVENLEVVSRYMCRCRILEHLYLGGQAAAAEEFKLALVKLYGKILIYLSKSKSYFDQKKIARIISSTFGDKSEFQEMINDINQTQVEVSQCATLICREDECSRYSELKKVLEQFDAPLQRMTAQLQNVQDHLEESKRKKILGWMSEVEKLPYAKYHRENKRQILEGTGQWLLRDPVFRTWKYDSASSLLWLHGIPGSGKSKLTALVTEDALKCSEAGISPRPAYFYCSRNAAEPLRSNSTSILGSIARQLANLNPTSPLFPPAVKKYAEEEAQGNASGSLDIEDSKELIAALIEHSPITTIIIDALDECSIDERANIIEFIKMTLEKTSSLVKFFVSSRKDQDIVYQFETFPNLDISSTKNQADIQTFVENETKQLIEKGKLLRNSQNKACLGEEIIQKVTGDAEGMFRWASLQLQNLCTLKTDDDIRERLGKIPPTLEDLYSEIYERIKQTQGETTQKIVLNAFSLLLTLNRNLSPQGFATIAQPTEGELSLPTILDICCNLVVLDETLQVFRFAHLSVREFLDRLPEFDSSRSHATVAACCMRIAGNWDKKGLSSDAKHYVRFNMLYHFQEVGRIGRLRQPVLMQLIRLIREDLEPKITPAHLRAAGWHELESIDSVPDRVDPSLGFIFNACALGFCEVVTTILDATCFRGNRSVDPPSESENPAEIEVVFNALQELPRPKEFSIKHLTKLLDPEAIAQLSAHAIRHGNYGVLSYLLEKKSVDVSEDLLIQVVRPYTEYKACYQYWSEPADMVDLVLDYGGMEHVTTAAVTRAVQFAWQSKETGFTRLIIKALLDRGMKFQLSEEFLDSIDLQAIAWSRRFFAIESILLLAEAQAENKCNVLCKLLEEVADYHIWHSNDQLIRLLNISDSQEITQQAFTSITNRYAYRDFGTFDPLVLMMKKNPDLRIDETILLRAARPFDVKMKRPLFFTTHETIGNVAVGRHRSVKLFDFLLERTSFPITQSFLEALAEASTFPSCVRSVLERYPDLQVTEKVLIGIIKYDKPGVVEALEYLRRKPGFQVTRRVIVEIMNAPRPNRGSSAKLKWLLEWIRDDSSQSPE